jgi:hypothetical protein
MSMKLKLLKWPNHENFGSEFLIPSKPIRVGTYKLKEKFIFGPLALPFDVFSTKIVLTA